MKTNRFEIYVGYFTKGLHHFSSADSEENEAWFSSTSCDSCGSNYGGDRFLMHAWDENDEAVELDVCVDCLFYHEYGDVPGQWYYHPREYIMEQSGGYEKYVEIFKSIEHTLELAGYPFVDMDCWEEARPGRHDPYRTRKVWMLRVNDSEVFEFDWRDMTLPDAVDNAVETVLDYLQVGKE